MRLSNFYMPTSKDAPNDAELASHKLMLRAALIHKLGQGLYTWLPLGLRVLRKIEKIVNEEMRAIGAQEILMPAVQPKEIWEESGRWEEFGPQLLKMEDRQKRNFCFGPTHEEVITNLIRDDVKSYKQLPFSLYQIQTKFRDEIRPRFGVMRAREFIMKDAYSFHDNQESLAKTYEDFRGAYTKIVERIGLNFRIVEADSGSIGGSKSEEFHALADSGEDILVYSDQSDYAANLEKASALINETPPKSPTLSLEIVPTPGVKTVSEQSKFLGISESDIIKTLVVKGDTTEAPAIALLIRGNRELNPLKAEKQDGVLSPLEFVEHSDIEGLCGCEPGSIGPIELNLPIIADKDVLSMSDFSCGANATDKHYVGVNWSRDLPPPSRTADLSFVKEGDLAPDSSGGKLKFTRGSELGHIFQLGTKYSESMNATVLNKEGKPIPMLMGCYGIGVSRIVGATIEQCHDDNGIVWPEAIAPFEIALVSIGYAKDDVVREKSDEVYNLISNKYECLLDDRNVRPGVAFKDIELIGIPHRLVISNKLLEEGAIEYKRRLDGFTCKLQITEIQNHISNGNLLEVLRDIN